MKYKNISKETLTLIGIGEVKPGEIVELPENFNNANFEKINKKPVEPDNNKQENE